MLKILPGTGDIIRARISEKRLLSSSGRYDALFYTWEGQIPTERIVVGNEDFYVGRNVFDALKRLRQPLKSRFMWIDSVCINQNAASEPWEVRQEKGEQVKVMGEIFRRASTVFAWLGEAESGSDEVLVDECIRRWPNRGHIGPAKSVEGREVAVRIAKHTYWTRTWVLQECVLAKRVVFCHGAAKVECAKLEEFLLQIHIEIACSGEPLLVPEYQNVEKIFHLMSRHNTPQRKLSALLWDNIEDFAHTQCSDPRDKIYALLSISAPPSKGKGLTNLYSKDLVDVYLEAGEVYGDQFPRMGPGRTRDDVSLNKDLANALGITKAMVKQRLIERGDIDGPSGFLTISDAS